MTRHILRRFDAASICVALAAATLVLNTSIPPNCDVAWFITFAEKVLDGARPYIDVADPNLPGAWLIYLPAVAAARAIGVAPETATLLQSLIAASACLWFALRLLEAGGLGQGLRTPLMAGAATFACTLSWGIMIAQREHMAALFTLPLVAAAALRADGQRLPRAAAPVIGALAFAAVAIKPTHAAVPLACAIYVCLARRSLRFALAPEYVIAAAMTVIGTLAMAIWTPAFFTEELPQITSLYSLMRFRLSYIATDPRLLASVAALAAALAVAPSLREPRMLAFAAAGCGYLASAVLQGKMVANHLLPGLTYALFALSLAVLSRLHSGPTALTRRLLVPALAISPVAAYVNFYFTDATLFNVGRAIIALAPERPTIGGLNYLIDVSFPSTLMARGRWVHAENSIWGPDQMAAIMKMRPVTPAQESAMIETVGIQRRRVAAELRRARPDVILVDDAETRHIETSTPELGRALDGYVLAAHVEKIEIWLRSELVASAAAARQGMTAVADAHANSE